MCCWQGIQHGLWTHSAVYPSQQPWPWQLPSCLAWTGLPGPHSPHQRRLWLSHPRPCHPQRHCQGPLPCAAAPVPGAAALEWRPVCLRPTHDCIMHTGNVGHACPQPSSVTALQLSHHAALHDCLTDLCVHAAGTLQAHRASQIWISLCSESIPFGAAVLQLLSQL